MGNRQRRIGLRHALLITVVAIAAASAQGAGVVLKMATLVPQGTVWHTTLLELGQAWQKASGGQVTLRLYPGGVAGDDTDVVRKMRLGSLDAGLLTSAGLAEVDRAIFALSVPMAYASYGEVDYVLDKLGGQLETIYQDKGFIVLGWADAGWVHFFARSPVVTPDDLRRQKLFNWAGDSRAVEVWKAAGFNPIPLPSTEISTALQTGLVTALPTTVQAALLLQWFTHAPYMTDLNWAVLLGGIVVSKAAWEKVPAPLRPALRAAALEAAAKLREQTRSEASADVVAMSKRGLKVVHVDATAEAAWRKTVEAAYPKVRGSYVPAAVFDAALALRDEYRASGAGKPTR
ncbi:MAG: TRAP transporter substrate-binding protein DctP [Thermoanaerobaculales bacterium]